MKHFILLPTLLFTQLSFSQIKSRVVDGESQKGIPYVNIWVENQSIGTTSNENGAFTLQTNDSVVTIVFSAIGYAITRVPIENIADIVELHPQAGQLEEVVVTSLSKKLTVGEIKKRGIDHYFACHSKPIIVVWHFNYDTVYSETPYIETLRLLTRSNIKNAIFSIRLYAVNEDGTPGTVINQKNIIATAKKGKKITEIDLSNHRIQLPKNGIYIGYEFMVIESNKYEYNYYIDGSRKKQRDGITHEPKIGIAEQETPQTIWRYFNGKWAELNAHEKRDHFQSPAMQIVLTN